GLASFTGQVGTVTFLLLFLPMSGDLFRRKLIGIFGTDPERERSTRKMLEDISTQVQRYLLIQIGSSVLAGLAVGVTYAFLGVDKPLMWGIVTAVLHMVPYIGALVATALATFMAFVQFGTFGVPMAVLISSVGIHTLIGQLLVPLLTSKVSTLNTVTVFVSVLAWGWLWGVWGLLLGIPITMALKAICDEVEGFRGIGELLGN
ncbi:MAG: AI-2E family transporter, partial [Firmicutes bacterium]|nr:AI-2E family transporter [Bacillota bacterium]